MNLEEQLSAALKSEEPIKQIRQLMQSLIAQGEKRESILTELENYRQLLQKKGQDREEDMILEVMDFLTGWCSPNMRI